MSDIIYLPILPPLQPVLVSEPVQRENIIMPPLQPVLVSEPVQREKVEVSKENKLEKRRKIFIIRMLFLNHLLTSKNKKYRFAAETAYRVGKIFQAVNIPPKLNLLFTAWLNNNIIEKDTPEGRKFSLYFETNKIKYFITNLDKNY